MNRPTQRMLLPLLVTLFLLFVMMPIISQSLTMKLIPPSSPESPFYTAGLSFLEKADRVAKHSISRALYLSYKHKHKHGHRGLAPKPNVARAPASEVQGVYVIKLGIGTFPGKTPTHKSYYMVMDTGSHKIWVQCDNCERIHRCMPQKGEPPFPCHLSKTCHPIKCVQHGFHISCDGTYEFCDKQRICLYRMAYLDNTSTMGFVAHETFTFEGPKPNQHVAVKGIRFGCGVDQLNMNTTGEPDNRVAGLVGLGWGPDSLHTQLDSLSDSTFSYCLPPLFESIDHETYLSFGAAAIGEITTPEFKETSMMLQAGGYLVFIEDISVNHRRLNVSLGSTDRFSEEGRGRAIVVDSGTIATRLPKPMFDAAERAISKVLSRNRRVVRVKIPGLDQICYNRTRPERNAYAGLPTMTYHLQDGAEFAVGPEGMFIADGNQFCLGMVPIEEDEGAILGAIQQVNKKIIFDPKRSRLIFKPQVC